MLIAYDSSSTITALQYGPPQKITIEFSGHNHPKITKRLKGKRHNLQPHRKWERNAKLKAK